MGVRGRGRPAWAVWLIAALCACGPIDESQPGALGNGTFAYGCVSGNDTFCPSGGSPDTPFPSGIALYAPFHLSYFPTSGAYSTVAVVPVSPDFIATQEASPPAFSGLRPGTPWFYVLLPDDRILDITSVTIEEIAGIRVADTAGVSGVSFTETVGAQDTFTATALDASRIALAGDVLYTWSASNPAVVTLVAASGASSATATFTGPGTSTITVSTQGAQSTFTVTVNGS